MKKLFFCFILVLVSFVFAQRPILPTQFAGLLEITFRNQTVRGGVFYNGDAKKSHLVQYEGQNKNTSHLLRGDLVSKKYSFLIIRTCYT